MTQFYLTTLFSTPLSIFPGPSLSPRLFPLHSLAIMLSTPVLIQAPRTIDMTGPLQLTPHYCFLNVFLYFSHQPNLFILLIPSFHSRVYLLVQRPRVLFL